MCEFHIEMAGNGLSRLLKFKNFGVSAGLEARP
jgi:hypothetical protein